MTPTAYSGGTFVNGGTLLVNGSVVTPTTVNSDGTLGGTGTVGATTVAAGGTLAPGSGVPGSALNVTGTLTLQPGSTYVVQVDPSAVTTTNVSGTASLSGGSVQAVLAPGGYVAKSYTILSSAGLGGTVFNGVAASNLPPAFGASLSYTATNAILNLTAQLGSGLGLNVNAGNVASAINGYFNGGGVLPPNFVTVFGLTGGSLAGALTQSSGEAATGAEHGAFQLVNQFLGVMLDPSVDRASLSGAANSFASSAAQSLPPDAARAYAAAFPGLFGKAPPPDQRWAGWATAYGGTNKTGGDAVTGSHDVSAHTGGVAAGLEYRVSPDAALGFALAGGGTNWALSQGLGGGRSDAFQAGVYGTTRAGPLYWAGALAFTQYWASSGRVGPLGDQLSARFDARSFGGRLEGGYRAMTPWAAVTPYAALQAQSFHTPSYVETDLGSGGFALAYGGRQASDTRSELGARLDRQMATGAGTLWVLRGRLAWAHDWVGNPAITAAFQSLPGASFIVSGAAPVHDLALARIGSEVRLAGGLVVAARVDGEFAGRVATYAGTGSVRYTW